MKYAQRNKKIYAICIALLFIISSTAALIPNLEVKAADTEILYLKDTPLINFIPSGDELFNMPDYRFGVESSNLSEEILLGCNSGILLDTSQTNGYTSNFNLMKDFLNDPTTGVTGWNSGYALNDIQIKTSLYTVTDDWLIDYLHGDQSFNTYVTIVQDSTTFHITFYISTSELSDNSFVCNGGGYFYDTSATVYYFSLDFSASSYSNGTPINLNSQTYNVSNTTIPPLGSSFFTYLSYSDFKVYFTWQSGHGNTYSSLNSKTAIKDLLAAGQTSDFLIDRRTLMDNWGTPNYTVDTDPVSIDEYGMWNMVFNIDDFSNGHAFVGYFPTNRTVQPNEDIKISFTYTYVCNYSANGLYLKLPNVTWNGGNSKYYFKSKNTGEASSLHLNSPMHATWSESWTYANNDLKKYNINSFWQNFTSKSGYDIDLPYITDVGNGSYTHSFGNTKPIDLIQALIRTGSITPTTYNLNVGSEYGGISAGVDMSLIDGVQNMTVSVVGTVESVSQGLIDTCTITYDCLTGTLTKSGLMSTNNNSNLSDQNNLPYGYDSNSYNNMIQSLPYTVPSTGETVSNSNSAGGGNSNSNSNSSGGQGGTATASANNNINVKSNWQYFIESTEESTENQNGLAAIQNGYEEVINFDYQNDSFLSFLFTSGIWSIHPFDYILAFLGTMVTIGIFTGILKLFRG